MNTTIGDFRGAIEDFDRMLVAARSLPDRHRQAMALACRGWAEHHDHHVGTTEETLKTALAMADEGFEDVRFFASASLAGHFLVYNRHAEAEPFLRECEALAPRVDDPFILGWWGLFESLWPNWQGRFDDALKIQAQRRGAGRRGGYAFLMNSWVKAIARGGKGEYEQALALLEDLLATGKRMGEVFFLARALNIMGWLYGEIQDPRQAMAWNRQAVAAAQEGRFAIPEVESNARLNLGDNLLALGRLEEAEAQFQTVEQVVRNPRPQDHWMLWRYSQHLFHSHGELWLARGDPDKAMAYADECLALAEESNSQKNIIKARRLRGQAFLAQGKLEEAGQELSIALEVAHRVGNPTQLWKTHAALGDLLQAQGRPEAARRAYGDALAVIDEVAAGLRDPSRRDTFTSSRFVEEIRQKAGDKFGKTRTRQQKASQNADGSSKKGEGSAA